MATKAAKKKTAQPDDVFVVNRRSRWVEWIDKNDPDGVPFRARIRSNLTFGEIDNLAFEPGTEMTIIHGQLAPYVYEWNVAIEENGAVVEVPAPADAGGEVFDSIPNLWFWWLWRQVKNEGTERLDPKGSAESGLTPDSDDESSSE